MGEKPYTELTYYLYSFDVCLIPFKVLDLTNATNPVKLYEYLCAGKPVVADRQLDKYICAVGVRTHGTHEYFRHGGILQYVLRNMMKEAA